MMFTTVITALAVALFTQATQAKPLGALTDIGAKFPVLDLPLGSTSVPNATLARGGGAPHPDIVPSDFPAFLLLCSTVSCISCFQLDMSVIPHNSCINPGVPIVSMAISQPTNVGLDFGVFLGPAGCLSFAQLPTVNTCFNAAMGGPFADYALA